MDKYTGKRIDGRYEINELIGIGGMAEVYKAHDIVDDKIVAIKILKDEYLGNKEFIRRFKNESKAISVLSHPNIVKVYDVSFGDKIQYIVMEYIDGITLKEYIEQQHKIKWKEVVYFTVQILKALQHAHEKGIIHRDIKPQNIILLQDGTIKVTDFGIARFSKYETRTMTDKAIGSVHYISPEQARGDVIDEKTDIYSVGVMLYEMTTGELPFEADNAVSVAIMQLQSDPKPPREIDPSIPEGLEEIITKAMQKDPKNRYVSAVDMLQDIEEFNRNPSMKFNYKYFVDENPTKYVDSINKVKTAEPEPAYGDGYNYKDKDKDIKNKSKVTMIVGGIAAAVVLIALFFGIMAITKSCNGGLSKDVDIPNFIGMKLTDIQNDEKYKFKFQVESAYDSTKEEGIIIDQSPKSGAKKVKENATIILKVNSSGTLLTVPNINGMTQDMAEAKMKESGLAYEILSVNDDETAKGIVKNTEPKGGNKVTANTTVKVYVSKGSSEKKVNVPDVINKSFSAAKNELISKGLKISEDIATQESDKPKDTVIASDPLPGVEVSEGYAVKLTLSSGVQKEKTIEIFVDLPSEVTEDLKITSYVDGVLVDKKEVSPAYYKNTYTLYVNGTTGTKKVNVNLNDQAYREFEVNFDSSTDPVKTIKKYSFNASSSSTQNNSSNG